MQLKSNEWCAFSHCRECRTVFHKSMAGSRFSAPSIEWPTVGLLVGCYALWLVATSFYQEAGPLLLVLIAAPLVTLHSSLQHEALHGHPTRFAAFNEVLVFLPLGLL